MAKAKAECTCKDCGEKFVSEKICRNRKEADSWEEWASSRFDTCPECYKKWKKEKEIEKGLYFDVRLDAIGAMHSEDDCIAIVFGGNTMPYKDEIKALGAIWTEEHPKDDVLNSLLSMRIDFKWVLRCNIDELEEKVSLAEGIGARCNSVPSEVDMAIFSKINEERKQKAAEKKAELENELSSIGNMPDWNDDVKEIMESGRWNGKFYGRTGKWKIYLSGNPVDVTDEQKASIEDTQKAQDIWKEKRSNIIKSKCN